MTHEKIPIPGIRNPRNIRKIKNPESQGLCENPGGKNTETQKIPDPGDKNPETQKNPEFRGFAKNLGDFQKIPKKSRWSEKRKNPLKVFYLVI